MLEPEQDGASYKLHQLVGLFAGPALFAVLALSPTPAGLSASAWAVAALAAWMAAWCRSS